MLGFRLNKLGAAIGSGFSLRSLFGGGSAGYSFSPYLGETNKQTYNQPGTDATAAGDPIGAMLPAHAYEGIINRLEWSDGFSQTSEWTATNVTVTANTKNDSGVGNTDGASPVADTLNATVAGGSISQSYTCTADTAVRTASIDLEAGTATNSTLSLVYTGGNTYSAAISWSGGVPTVTNAGSAGASDVGAELQATGIYKIWVRGANDNRTTASLTLLPAASGTGTVFASRAQVNDGSTVLAYQPSAGCLGGSNRRSGGANQILWSQDVANPGWTKTNVTTSDDGTVTATAGTLQYNIVATYATTVSGNTYTFTVDIDYTNYQFVQIYVTASSTPGFANFDLVNITVNATTATASITDLGGNSRRLVFTYVPNSNNRVAHIAFSGSLASARAPTLTLAGTESFKIVRAWQVLGTSSGTYTRNMGVLGGLITNVPLYQTTSGNRPLLARFPKTGIRNRLLNNMMTGGIAGSPGTVPTGYTAASPVDGLSRQDVSFNTTTGTWVAKWSGTSGTAGNVTIAQFSGTATIPAVNGQTWAFGMYLSLSAGTLTNVSSLTLRITFRDSGATSLTTVESSILGTISGTPQLLQVTGTASNASTAFVSFSIVAGFTDSSAVDFTLTMTTPQAELGSSLTTIQQVVSASDITESGVGHNYLPLYDGTSDFMTPGMQSWGTTQLQAAAQYAFTIFFVFRTVSASGGGIISQNNGAATAAMMFSLFVGSSTGAIGLNARGTAATAWGSDNRDGVFHVGALRWNGTSFDQILDSGALTAVTWAGGSLAATAIDIAVGMERVSTAARPFNGHLGVAFIDRACTDAEMLAGVRSLNAIYRSGL